MARSLVESELLFLDEESGMYELEGDISAHRLPTNLHEVTKHESSGRGPVPGYGRGLCSGRACARAHPPYAKVSAMGRRRTVLH